MVVPSAPQLYLAASKILEEKCILIYGGDNTKIHKDSFGDKKYNYKALSVQQSIAVRLVEGTSFPWYFAIFLSQGLKHDGRP